MHFFERARPASFWVTASAVGLLCSAVVGGGIGRAAAATESGREADTIAAKSLGTPAQHPIKVKKKSAKHVRHEAPTGPVFKGPPVAELPPPIPACSAQSAYAIDKTYGIKGWDFPAFNMGDSILLDYGCWRTNLAKYGFGVIAFNVGIFQTNVINHYVPPTSHQQYAGQRNTGENAANVIASYDLSRWGLTDGLFQAWVTKNNTTDAPNYTQNRFAMSSLAIYGTAFNRQVEYMLGYVPFNNAFQGNYIGGNVNNPLGAQATNAVLVGGNYSTVMTPSGIVKWHITDAWYNTFGVNRSTPGSLAPFIGFSGNALAVESYTNHSGLNFVNSHPCVFGNCYPSPGAVLTDELGYKTEASSGVPYTWVRAEGYVNIGTNYYDLQRNNGAQTNAFSASFFADRQIWQAEPDSPHTAYKGLYVGMTFGYNNPEQAVYTQDYEARIYTFGMFNRPRDQIAISSQHLTVSPYWATDMSQVLGCSARILCPRHAVNNYTLTYTAYIMPGVYFSLGATYSDHPSIVWSPLASGYGSAAFPVPALAPFNIQGALNFQAALVTVF